VFANYYAGMVSNVEFPRMKLFAVTENFKAKLNIHESKQTRKHVHHSCDFGTCFNFMIMMSLSLKTLPFLVFQLKVNRDYHSQDSKTGEGST
jgi:hypothetical protein